MSEGRRWWNGAGRRALWPDPEKRWRALVGGPSGPTLFGRFAAIRNKSVGPEGPLTKA
ncbi:DUF6053 domain-containing protein [Lysobacter enzymogenes]|uniref:DUF6053 domain-containing protein n=1 Tax=Lysobacter enzymogenes TaxID=69 RepID=UPI003D18E77B